MKFVLLLAICCVAYVSAAPQNIGFQYLDEAIKQAQSEGKFENEYTIVSVSSSKTPLYIDFMTNLLKIDGPQ